MTTLSWRGYLMVVLISMLMPKARCWMTPDCPTDAFTPCAEANQQCSIPGNVRSGYFSMGIGGRYLLVPFTNDDGISVLTTCDYRSWGDAAEGKKKYCCYLETDVVLAPRGGYWDLYAQEGTKPFTLDAGYTVRFGVGSRWIYNSSPTRREVRCNYLSFGDWISDASSLTRQCAIQQEIPYSVEADRHWVTCNAQGGEHGGNCKGLSPGKVHWMRFRDLEYPDKWGNAHLVMSNDGEFPCRGSALHDPSPDRAKFCQYSEPLILFGGSIGKWVRIMSCGGGCQQSIKMRVGVTKITSEELTTQWSMSFTSEISGDLIFGESTLSTTVSTSVAKTVSSSLIVSEEITRQIKCDRSAIYQFVIDSKQSSVTAEKSFAVETYDTFCGDNDPPKCPPGFCADMVDCQTCTEPLGMKEVGVEENESGSSKSKKDL